MFKNLDAEQARKGMSNSEVAEYLEISRTSYEKKKKNGNFRLKEINKLLYLFNSTFDYLFDPITTTEGV